MRHVTWERQAIVSTILAISLACTTSPVVPPSAGEAGPPAAPARQAAVPRDDWTTLRGSTLHSPRIEDLRMLGIAGQAMFRRAQRQGQVTPPVQELADASVAAYKAEDWPRAFRLVTRLSMVLQGGTLSEATEVATAYDLLLSRKIAAPGEVIAVELRPLFTLGEGLSGTYTIRLSVLTDALDAVQRLAPLSLVRMESIATQLDTAALAAGHYWLAYELFAPSGEPVIKGFRDFTLDAEVGKRVKALLATVRSQPAPDGLPVSVRAGRETVEYLSATFDRMLTGYYSVSRKMAHPMTTHVRVMAMTEEERLDLLRPAEDNEPVSLATDLAFAEELAADLAAGRDPLAGRVGDMHLAYRSRLDGTLQPYRAFIPDGYDPEKRYPLVLGLHGASGDENAFMNGADFKQLGQERGYLLATPYGRGPFGGYQGDSAEDVLEVLDRMQAMYAVDAKAVFLTGHSMGGGGTWRIGFATPERFTALAPIAGAPPPDEIKLQAAPAMPVLYSVGGQDMVVPIGSARRLAKTAEGVLKDFSYREYPDDKHNDVPRSAMRSIFDFFVAHRGGR